MINTVSDSHAVQLPGGKVTLVDAVEIIQGGIVVAKLDAEFDFTNVDPTFHLYVLNVLMTRCRVCLYLPTFEKMEEEARRSERYAQRQAKYAALPWWKKIFTLRPRYET
jgi:hypothetical protein